MWNNKKKKVVLAYYLYKKKQKETVKCKRSLWVHPILLEREEYGAFHTLFRKLEEDETKFFNYFRMKKETFQLLLTAIYDKITHEDTDMRKSISPAERLAVTLRYVKTCSIFAQIMYRGTYNYVKKKLYLYCKRVSIQNLSIPDSNSKINNYLIEQFYFIF